MFSMEIKPTGLKSGWTNIFHAMTGKGRCCSNGARIPAIFMYSQSTRLHVCNSVNGRGNYYVDFDIPMGKFTKVDVKQAKRSSGEYRNSIFVDGKRLASIVNTKPLVFKDAKLYASNSFYNPASAEIRNLHAQSPIPADCEYTQPAHDVRTTSHGR